MPKAGAGQTRGMTAPEEIAVLRIELEDIEPLIWRRVAVRTSINPGPAPSDPSRDGPRTLLQPARVDKMASVWRELCGRRGRATRSDQELSFYAFFKLARGSLEDG